MPGVNDASDDWNPDNRARVRAPGTTKGWVSFVPEPLWVKREKKKRNMQQNQLSN